MSAPRDRRAALASLAAFVLPLGLYALTATRTVQGGDTAELATVGLAGGVPHPPGYPLYVMLARLAGALPVGAPVLRIAMLSALCAAAAVVVLERACFRLTGSRVASLGAALAFAVSPVQWQLAGVPEVFALHALLCACVLLAALHLAESPGGTGRGAALGLGLAFGLGLANHHTIVLLAPLGVWALLARGRHAGRRAALAAAALSAGAALACLALYAILPLAARTTDGWVWGSPTTARGLLEHVLRRDYGTLHLGLSAAPRRPLEHVGALLASLPRGYFYLAFAAGLGGLVAVWRQRGRAVALVATFALAAVVFPALFNLPRGPLAAAVATRFHLVPTLLYACFVAVGLAVLARRLSPVARVLLALGPVALAALATVGHADWRDDPTVERYLVAAVDGTAEHAVIFGQGDHELFGFTFVREALRRRRDVHFVDVHLLRRPWYHARVRREVPGLDLPFDPAVTRLGAVLERAAQRGPTYVTPSLIGAAGGIPLYPDGLLARVAGATAPPPPASLVPAAARALDALVPLPAHPIDAWSAHIRGQAIQSAETLAAALAQAGDMRAAEALRDRIRSLAPDP